jgi:hypothetical protein
MPFRQQYPLPQRRIVGFLGRQIEVEPQARSGVFAVPRHAEGIHVIRGAFAIPGRVFFGGPVYFDVLGPTHHAFGAEKHHEAVFAIRHVFPLGLAAPLILGCRLGLTRFGPRLLNCGRRHGVGSDRRRGVKP